MAWAGDQTVDWTKYYKIDTGETLFMFQHHLKVTLKLCAHSFNATWQSTTMSDGLLHSFFNITLDFLTFKLLTFAYLHF